MLGDIVVLVLGFLPYLLTGIFFLYIALAWATLSHVPGPFLAAFTNLPRLLWVRARRAHEIHIGLHNRYGHLVRIGPNMVSVGDPAEVRHIYGFSGSFKKVQFTLTRLNVFSNKLKAARFSSMDCFPIQLAV